ncbi:MAG: PEP-CTERM sorting domain-containing protein [Phycisphaeraceae bacterium]
MTELCVKYGVSRPTDSRAVARCAGRVKPNQVGLSLVFVQTMQLIVSMDPIFGNADDVILGAFNVDGASAVTFNFPEVIGKYVRFQSLTTVAGFNPGAQEIQLFGNAIVPEPATTTLALFGLGGLLLRLRRQARVMFRAGLCESGYAQPARCRRSVHGVDDRPEHSMRPLRFRTGANTPRLAYLIASEAQTISLSLRAKTH